MHVVHGAEHDHCGVGEAAAHFLEERHPVHPLHPDVADEDRHLAVLRQDREGGVAGIGGAAGQPLGFHDPRQRVANLGVVINDEALGDGGGSGGIGGVRHRWKVRRRGAILNAVPCRNAFSPIRFLHLNRCDP